VVVVFKIGQQWEGARIPLRFQEGAKGPEV
jgi:hypothetical protein